MTKSVRNQNKKSKHRNCDDDEELRNTKVIKLNENDDDDENS